MKFVNKSFSLVIASALTFLGVVTPGNAAYAAGELTMQPSAGLGWGTFSTDSFTTTTYFNGSGATDVTLAGLRYEVITKANVTISDQSALLFSGVPSGPGNKIVLSPTNPTSSGNLLHIGLGDQSSSAIVQLRVFVDANLDGDFNLGEWSDVHDISFTPVSKTPLVIDVTRPVSMDTSLAGKLDFTGVNPQQVQTHFALDVSGYSSRTREYIPLGQTTVSNPLTYDLTVSRPLVTDEALSVRLQIGDSFDSNAAPLAEVFPVVAARLVTGLSSQLVTGPNAVNTSASSGTNPLGASYYPGGFSGEVRQGGSFDVSVRAVKNAEGTLTFVSSEELSKDVTLTVDGVEYASNAQLESALIKYSFDNDGVSIHHVQLQGFGLGSSISFFFASEGYSVETSATVAAPAFTLFDLEDRLNNNYRSVAPGSTVEVKYKMVDQFGQPPETGKFAVATAPVDGLEAVHADFTSGIAIIALKAPANPEIHLYSIVPRVFQYGTAESFSQATPYDDVSLEDGFSLQVAPADQVTPNVIGLAQILADTRLDDGGTFTDFDGRFDRIVPTYQHGQRWRLTIKGSDSLKHNVSGASVTISAPGQQIVSADQGGFGSLTLLSDRFGEVEFTIYSHKSGPIQFSVTSGKTNAVATNSWTPLTLSYVTAVKPTGNYQKNTTVVVGFNGFDRYGNACADTYVPFGAVLSGEGYLLGPLSDPWDVVDIAFVNGYGYVKLVNQNTGSSRVTVKNVSAVLNFGSPTAFIQHLSKSKIALLTWSNLYQGDWPVVIVNGHVVTLGNASSANGSGSQRITLKRGLNKIRVFLDGLLLAAQDVKYQPKK